MASILGSMLAYIFELDFSLNYGCEQQILKRKILSKSLCIPRVFGVHKPFTGKKIKEKTSSGAHNSGFNNAPWSKGKTDPRGTKMNKCKALLREA